MPTDCQRCHFDGLSSHYVGTDRLQFLFRFFRREWVLLGKKLDCMFFFVWGRVKAEGVCGADACLIEFLVRSWVSERSHPASVGNLCNMNQKIWFRKINTKHIIECCFE